MNIECQNCKTSLGDNGKPKLPDYVLDLNPVFNKFCSEECFGSYSIKLSKDAYSFYGVEWLYKPEVEDE